MLKTKKIEIKLNAKTIKWYWELGYKGTTNDIIKIKISDLKPTSHYRVLCACDYCHKEKTLAYKSYVEFTSKDGRYYCHKCCTIKKQQTYLGRYGVNHPLKHPDIQKKVRETCQRKYGADSYLLTQEYLNNDEIKERARQKHILAGRILAEDEITPFESYKRKCRRLTSRNKLTLYEQWDGYDYYDGEYIKNYASLPCLDRRSPTMDHKISILYGFRNGMSPEEISCIDNLCITKRSINCSKRAKNHNQL